MATASSYGVVESWSEWDTLREVWLGTLEQKNLQPANCPGIVRKMACYDRYKWDIREELPSDKGLVEAKKQLDNYLQVLEGEGIIVQRPSPFLTEESIKTPFWSVDRMGGFTCPRDCFFVAGKQIIEAPMSWRPRYFENLAWRDLLMSYFTADPRMRWTVAPKPKLADDSWEQGGDPGKITNKEIFFDAADCRRFGKDIFVQAHYGTANHLGRDWIKRELGASGMRVHDMEFEEFHYSHLDARLTPVDEGLAMYSGSDKPTAHWLNVFNENEWNLIDVGCRSDCRTRSDHCAPGIHMNVLTIAPRVCIVEKHELHLQKLLLEEGCDVIPIEFSACYSFGGSLNCFTLDIYRQGPAAKCYFPSLEREAERSEAEEAAAAEIRHKQLLQGFEQRATNRHRMQCLGA